MPLEQHQIDRAKELLRHQWPMSRVARAVGTNYNTLRNAIDPEWHTRRRQAERERYTRSCGPTHFVPAKPESPDDLLAERDRLSNMPKTLSQHFFGDPMPGRSALDRKLASGV